MSLCAIKLRIFKLYESVRYQYCKECEEIIFDNYCDYCEK